MMQRPGRSRPSSASAASARTSPPCWGARSSTAPSPTAASSPARQLASYVGIAPTPHQSGGTDRDRSISRAGNARARTALIQLAWLWLRYQPGSALATWFRERVGALQGRTRRIAIVAMARRLLVALWRYVETGVMPDGAAIRAEATA